MSKPYSTTKVKISCAIRGDTFNFDGYQDKATELFKKWLDAIESAYKSIDHPPKD